MREQGPFDTLSAAGVGSSAAGSGAYHPAFFAQTTSEWSVYKDSDIPKIPDTKLEITLDLITIGALYIAAFHVVLKVAVMLIHRISWNLLAADCPASGDFGGLSEVTGCRVVAVLDFLSKSPWLDFGMLCLITIMLIRTYRRYRNPKREEIYYTRRRKKQIRYIWAGSGQAQFGCGTRGISITNSNKFNYLLWWDKIEYIYFEDDHRHLGFTQFSPWGDDEKPVEVRENLEFFFPPQGHYSNAPTKRNNHTKGAIRIRLVPGYSNQSFVEEIIIPARFFGTSHEATSREKFLRCCWEFKWRHAHVWPMRYKSTQT